MKKYCVIIISIVWRHGCVEQSIVDQLMFTAVNVCLAANHNISLEINLHIFASQDFGWSSSKKVKIIAKNVLALLMLVFFFFIKLNINCGNISWSTVHVNFGGVMGTVVPGAVKLSVP